MKNILKTLVLVCLGVITFSQYTFSAWGPNDFTTTDFEIDVTGLTPGDDTLAGEMSGDGAKWIADAVLWKVIQSLMIVMWVLALFTMTVGAGYMIIHYWQEEQLSKWKSIFVSGLIGLAVALASYWIIALVRYILYS